MSQLDSLIDLVKAIFSTESSEITEFYEEILQEMQQIDDES